MILTQPLNFIARDRYFGSVKRIVSAAFAAFFLYATPAITVACDNDPECGDPTAWAGFTRIVMKESYQDTTDVSEWRASFDHKTNDALIDTKMHVSGNVTSGTVALVGGRIMLSKGLKLKAGYEIDALDGPVLSMKLAMIVLGRIYPKGPEQISGQQDIDFTDLIGIKFATSSASGYIAAPWHVKGGVNKLSSGNVTFDLALTFPMVQGDEKNKTYTMKMAGELSTLGHPVFRDTDSLDGWMIYGVGPQVIKQAGSTIFDYGAKPDEGDKYKTIGDIRAYIAAENNPGTKDATKNFTGFWKQNCDQAYGLQIMPYGDDGKYSIVFCGPGGCGEPSEGHLTFISGDKRFEVVSEDELIEIGRSGDRETYHRCTKETHPVLKYPE